jgi:hypothetical protein
VVTLTNLIIFFLRIDLFRLLILAPFLSFLSSDQSNPAWSPCSPTGAASCTRPGHGSSSASPGPAASPAARCGGRPSSAPTPSSATSTQVS